MTGKFDFRTLVVTALALLVLALAPGSAAAQVRVARSVDYDFIVDPPVVSLARIEEMRPVGAVVDVRVGVTITPDKAVRWGYDLRDAARAFKKSVLHSDALRQTLAEFSGASPRLHWLFMNEPSLTEAYRGEGFTPLASKSYAAEGETVTLFAWVKTEVEPGASLGTASAVLNLEANPTIDSVTSVFEGNFKKTESSEISADGLPEAGATRDLARTLYDAFRQETNRNFNRVLQALNAPLPMLSEEERLSLIDMPVGKTMEFIRTISYTWYGEEKTVRIIVKATLGPLRFQELGEDIVLGRPKIEFVSVGEDQKVLSDVPLGTPFRVRMTFENARDEPGFPVLLRTRRSGAEVRTEVKGTDNPKVYLSEPVISHPSRKWDGEAASDLVSE